MPDHKEPNARGLFGGVFAKGGVEAGDIAWLQAMLDAEAGLARELERAGLAPAGSGEAVTATASSARSSSPRAAAGYNTRSRKPERSSPRAPASSPFSI